MTSERKPYKYLGYIDESFSSSGFIFCVGGCLLPEDAYEVLTERFSAFNNLMPGNELKANKMSEFRLYKLLETIELPKVQFFSVRDHPPKEVCGAEKYHAGRYLPYIYCIKEMIFKALFRKRHADITLTIILDEWSQDRNLREVFTSYVLEKFPYEYEDKGNTLTINILFQDSHEDFGIQIADVIARYAYLKEKYKDDEYFKYPIKVNETIVEHDHRYLFDAAEFCGFGLLYPPMRTYLYPENENTEDELLEEIIEKSSEHEAREDYDTLELFQPIYQTEDGVEQTEFAIQFQQQFSATYDEIANMLEKIYGSLGYNGMTLEELATSDQVDTELLSSLMIQIRKVLEGILKLFVKANLYQRNQVPIRYGGTSNEQQRLKKAYKNVKELYADADPLVVLDNAATLKVGLHKVQREAEGLSHKVGN